MTCSHLTTVLDFIYMSSVIVSLSSERHLRGTIRHEVLLLQASALLLSVCMGTIMNVSLHFCDVSLKEPPLLTQPLQLGLSCYRDFLYKS
ncbi:hypothetical protein ES702_02406 [subsurface metagenome]